MQKQGVVDPRAATLRFTMRAFMRTLASVRSPQVSVRYPIFRSKFISIRSGGPARA